MSPPPCPEPRRADARRNRERLLIAAGEAFAAGEPSPPSMDSIARRAGVGSGTLYRHFPRREDLVQAVYREQMQRLRRGAEELLAAEPPATALERWTELFADWAATKSGMREALVAAMDAGRLTPSEMREELVGILQGFLRAGARAGDLRGDVEARDLAAILAGTLLVAGAPGERVQLHGMLEVVLAGLRPR